MACRKIIEIDEALCDGCGACIPACAEGALRIVDGKARLVADVYCDGLGACLGQCPNDAIRLVEREAEAFDREAALNQRPPAQDALPSEQDTPCDDGPPCPPMGCPGSMLVALTVDRPVTSQKTASKDTSISSAKMPSGLANWPVQLHLVPPSAHFLRDAELLLVADCVPFALADFHARFLDGRPVVVGCPKLDDTNAYVEKLAAILTTANTHKIAVLRMEVPCCMGLVRLAQAARLRAGKEIPLVTFTVSVRGDIVAVDPPNDVL